MEIIESIDAKNVLAALPKPISAKLNVIRRLIFELATETESIKKLQETLKWGEPAYVVKQGSTIRLNGKKLSDEEYAIYFNCKTKLVDTFRERYKDVFVYEGNRAIIFNVQDEIPMEELKQCILLSLTYKEIKNLPLLGL